MIPSNRVTFYPIGENCLGHNVLQRHNVTLEATPFSHARSNIDYLNQMMRDDFSGFMDHDKLSHDMRGAANVAVNMGYSCDRLYEASVSNGFEFTHHDVIRNEDARASYERKTRRFQSSFGGEGVACFIYHYRLNKLQDIERVAEKLAHFRALAVSRASRPVLVCMFTQQLVSDDSQRGVDFGNPSGIPTAVLKTMKSWGGLDQDVFWGRNDDDLFARMIGAFQYRACLR